MSALEAVERRVKSKLVALSERTGFFDSIVKNLPPAVNWVILFMVITFLFDARKLETILSDQQVNGLGRFQEQITNQIFSGITSNFHPLTIFDLLMYALAFTVCAKVIPVLLNVAAARRTVRYRDYLNVLEEAIAVVKEHEAKEALKAAINSATPNQTSPPADNEAI